MQKFINIDPMEPGTVHETDALLIQSLSTSELPDDAQSYSVPSANNSLIGISLTSSTHSKKDVYDIDNMDDESPSSVKSTSDDNR